MENHKVNLIDDTAHESLVECIKFVTLIIARYILKPRCSKA